MDGYWNLKPMIRESESNSYERSKRQIAEWNQEKKSKEYRKDDSMYEQEWICYVAEIYELMKLTKRFSQREIWRDIELAMGVFFFFKKYQNSQAISSGSYLIGKDYKACDGTTLANESDRL